MSEKIVTAQPKHSEEVLSALEKTLAAHNLRLKPGETLENVVEALQQNQVTISAQHGYAVATMRSSIGTDTPVHLHEVIEGIAKKEETKFYPREVGNVTSRDSLDREGKLKYIREHGIRAWENLPQSAPTQRTVVLDKARLTKADWLSLDMKTRAQLSGMWGSTVVGQIMGRK